MHNFDSLIVSILSLFAGVVSLCEGTEFTISFNTVYTEEIDGDSRGGGGGGGGFVGGVGRSESIGRRRRKG